MCQSKDKKILVFSLLLITALLSGNFYLGSTFSFLPFLNQASAQTSSTSIIIDHQSVAQFDQLTDNEIVDAAAVRSLLRHASVGSNINSGLDTLYTGNHKYLRGNMVFQSRGNPGWQVKVDDLVTQTAAQLTKFDVFSMKYCYIDNVDPLALVTINGVQTTMWDYYKNNMEQLQTDYPTKYFIWWTMPIMTTGNANRDTFNNLVRDYAKDHDIILFDIAAIESHAPDGTLTTQNSYEAMYDPPDPLGYSSDGGHLTTVGAERVAKGWWVLMAELAKTNPRLGDWNLALNKNPISVSSTASGSASANALDGNRQTLWTSAAGGTQTLGIDLGAVYPLASVVIHWGSAYATYYYVETSSNGTSWGPSYTVTSGKGLENLGFTANTRYVRIRATQGVDPNKYELRSLEVYPAVSAIPTLTFGDLNQDGSVDRVDIDLLFQNWKTPTTLPGADVNTDSVVNGVDFSLVIKDWGK